MTFEISLIFALVFGTMLVLTVSSTEMTFADHDRYNDDRDNDYGKENDRDISDDKLEKEKRS